MGGKVQNKQLISYTGVSLIIPRLLTHPWKMTILISKLIEQIKLLKNNYLFKYQSDNSKTT